MIKKIIQKDSILSKYIFKYNSNHLYILKKMADKNLAYIGRQIFSMNIS